VLAHRITFSIGQISSDVHWLRCGVDAGQVLVGVFGPADVHPKDEKPDAATVVVTYRLPSGMLHCTLITELWYIAFIG
jgi:hypothetical protein